jgi:hypothetical protein
MSRPSTMETIVADLTENPIVETTEPTVVADTPAETIETLEETNNSSVNNGSSEEAEKW